MLPKPLARLLSPTFTDLFFVAVLIWLFIAGDGWRGLLLDGDCGWHIRTGEWILDHQQVPRVDLFSFTKAGEPWFAWEWLSEVLFAFLFRWASLKGVALMAGVVITAQATLLLRRIFAQNVNALVALGIGLLAVGAESIHFLARPHIFTLLFLSISLWILDADRRKESRRTWLLVPLTILWTNMHGGFVAVILCLGALSVGSAIETWIGRRSGWHAARRYGLMTLACLAATLVNPYGIQLHMHMVSYLQSDWIRSVVQEFQAPKFRGENLLQFELMLFAGLPVAVLNLRRGRIAEALWVFGFGHLALTSVRHVPLFVLVTAPLVAVEISMFWSKWAESSARKSVVRILEDMGRDIAPGFRRNSVWPIVVVAVIASLGDVMRWPKDLPEIQFPTKMVHAHAALLDGRRILTEDQWGDYLIFNNPQHKVFIDGRSDFYGEVVGEDYLHAIGARWDWREVLDKYKVDVVLARAEWSLTSVLKQDAGWKLVADDGKAVLFMRAAGQVPRPATYAGLRF